MCPNWELNQWPFGSQAGAHSDPLVHGQVLSPLSHTSQGAITILYKKSLYLEGKSLNLWTLIIKSYCIDRGLSHLHSCLHPQVKSLSQMGTYNAGHQLGQSYRLLADIFAMNKSQILRSHPSSSAVTGVKLEDWACYIHLWNGEPSFLTIIFLGVGGEKRWHFQGRM